MTDDLEKQFPPVAYRLAYREPTGDFSKWKYSTFMQEVIWHDEIQEPLHTADQLRAAYNAGLEAGAKVAAERESLVPSNTKAFRSYQDACRHIAAAIRSLKK